jgi:hypothetical protein
MFPELQVSLTEVGVTSEVTRFMGGFGKAEAKEELSP